MKDEQGREELRVEKLYGGYKHSKEMQKGFREEWGSNDSDSSDSNGVPKRKRKPVPTPIPEPEPKSVPVPIPTLPAQGQVDESRVDGSMNDEFSKALLDMDTMDPSGLAQQHVSLVQMDTDTGTSTSVTKKLSKQRVRTEQQHGLDVKVSNMPMIGGEFGMYACDKQVSKKMFSERQRAKPRWAVEALVLLRDEGRCQVCYEEYKTNESLVVMRKPHADGGQFDEYNCITICRECGKVWSTYKNFYLSRFSEEYDMWRQCLWVMRRRAQGRKGSQQVTTLSEQGMERYRYVMGKVETFYAREEVQKEREQDELVTKVGQVMNRRMTEDEYRELWRKFGVNEDIKGSENEKPELAKDPQSPEVTE